MEYKIGIPKFYWQFADSNPNLFVGYVKTYLRRTHPGFRPVRVKKPFYVVCIYEGNQRKKGD